MAQLNGISSFSVCGRQNVGGILTLEYTPIAYIDKSSFERIVSSSWNQQKNITFTGGNNWLTMPVILTKESWKENGRRTKQGKIYNQTLDFTMPFLLPAVAGELDQMAEHRYLIRLTDREEQKWLLGDLEYPFQFIDSGETGEEGGLKHYKGKFISQNPRKAIGFVPVF